MYLQALIALAYCHMRLGRRDLGTLYLKKARELDPSDRFGAARREAASWVPADDDEA